jgi:hypothetical protein
LLTGQRKPVRKIHADALMRVLRRYTLMTAALVGVFGA